MNVKSASVKFIFVTILIDAIGLGIIIPILPDVIRRFSSDPEFINQYFGYFISVYALMQFLASPVLGSLSDRFGRRSILLISLFGAALDYVLMAFAPNLIILFLGRAIAGLTGASMTVASSYMADISDDSNRSSNFGMIGAAFGFGFIAGPLIGGVLGTYGTHFPFLAAAVLCALNFFFGLFVLPESLPAEKRRKIEFSKMNPFLSLRNVLKPSPLVPLIGMYFMFYLAGHVHPSIWTLYMEHKFGWTPFQVGISLAVVGVCIALVQGGLTRVIIPKIGEVKALLYGLIIYMLGFVFYATVSEAWLIYVVIAVSSLGNIANPALQSMISKDTPSQEQGELQGSLMSLASLTAILAPLLYTFLFNSFTKSQGGPHFPGAPYMMAAFLCVLCLILFSKAIKKR